jgi:hypothetical protein
MHAVKKNAFFFIDIYIWYIKHKLPVFLSVPIFYKRGEKSFLLSS